MKRTIGGNRLGAGKKMTADLKTYERSTHDLSYTFRGTQASGTLVPFLVQLGLPGDTFDIELDVDILTHPTIGPLFGSYKHQTDVFVCPIRLYQGQLHNNKLGIGNNMDKVMLPVLELEANNVTKEPDPETGLINIDNEQINPSCLLSYLGIRGLGLSATDEEIVKRNFNAVPFLGYWDIYKNYYANKQEEIGAVIHGAVSESTAPVIELIQYTDDNVIDITIVQEGTGAGTPITTREEGIMVISVTINSGAPNLENPVFITNRGDLKLGEIWNNVTFQGSDGSDQDYYQVSGLKEGMEGMQVNYWRYGEHNANYSTKPEVRTFPLKNIDDMREEILAHAINSSAFVVNAETQAPYGWIADKAGEGTYFKTLTQEGLALKTYQSDLFNNWMQTEWIDGENGISAVTAIDTTSGKITIDTINLAEKVYMMKNRIALSGGTYQDWMDTSYTAKTFGMTETPVYVGGLSKELAFQEVVSNAQAETTEGGEQPLGTLAGRGVMTGKHKGGNVRVTVTEPCIIIGLNSLTPRLDYSQGNLWLNNLTNMGDLHVPALDEIGFQDLVTDQMAWWDTKLDDNGVAYYQSAGKQPAWLNYMTSVNTVRGNFADEDNQMWMTLNRKYQYDPVNKNIQDLTTYIDPMKFNNIFADTARDAQNFWIQIGVGITARRKMSAKIMPNL